MPFKRFVQLGRVCYGQFGPAEGKLCVVINILDQNRVLVDGPEATTGVKRQIYPLRWLMLTDYIVDIGVEPKHATLVKAFEKAEVEKKWKASAWGKKVMAREIKAKMTDFDRFKVHVLKKKRNQLVARELKKLKKAAKN
uniref:60S ribosomal protein L14-1 n=1 Tax=Stygiella incarcerata TaxID=1712417 RepID=A0A192ZI27_9EUKA|nr:60S ribosomal protein L14-1 [Stygiella incarcerata]|eukprot:TRINITY_DN1202_c0_g1_i1.p1 TRINITY_DN1202_c0_g1~~TRINITY_DN1202_c0_g1_i1.p1  ORF type:complete len:139 (+),score=36.90 TRINITY_DN1202_c0_g1_i1:93-509(+)